MRLVKNFKKIQFLRVILIYYHFQKKIFFKKESCTSNVVLC